MSGRNLLSLSLAATFAVLAIARGADEKPAADSSNPVSTFEHDIRPILEAQCFGCHGPKKQKGSVDFSRITDKTTILRARKVWRKGVAQLESRTMPPPEASKDLNDTDRKRLVQWMETASKLATNDDPASRDPGLAPSRRLSVPEYDNTVRDLLGVEFHSAEEVGMPYDAEGDRYGVYGNLTAALDMPQSVMDKYFLAADKILERFFGNELRSSLDGRIIERSRRARERLFGLKPGAWSDPRKTVVQSPQGKTAHEAARSIIAGVLHRAFRRPIEDHEIEQYMVLFDKASAKGENYVGSVRLMLKAVLVSPHFLYRVERDRAPEGSTAIYHLSDHELAVRLSYLLWSSMPDDWLLALADQKLLTAEKAPDTVMQLHGTTLGIAPQKDRRDHIREDVFDDNIETYYEGPKPDNCWVGLDLFAPREIRQIRYAPRPGYEGRMTGGKIQASNVADFSAEVVDVLTLDTQPKAGLTTLDLTLTQKFRYVRYVGPPKSYGTVAELQVYGLLSGPIFEEQVRRMLADPKAHALTENFGARWLQLNKLPFARPLTEKFNEFQPQHRSRMYDETAMFFDMLRQDDRSLLELIDADYTYLDEELAKYYKIPDVTGKELRRVALKPEWHRGGLLGMGGTMVLTSHADRTSPTQRGKFVLDVILGTPPPPPPPDAGILAEGKKNDKPMSFREKMAQHASNDSCIGCHRRMDPIGFAMENFNAVGIWREKDGLLALDTSGILPSGEKLAGIEDLKKVLLARQDDFRRNIAERILTYALGRELDFYDDRSVQQIADGLKQNQMHFSAMIIGVVNSFPFQFRRNINAQVSE